MKFYKKRKTGTMALTCGCLMLAMLLSMVACTYNREGYIDNETEKASETDTSSVEDTSTADKVPPGFPSIYPSAWKGMNAAIVIWGETNDQTWSELVREGCTVDYVGVDVEFVTVFSETMSKSNIDGIERIIEKTSYLMIPTFCLGEIKAGEPSLVFLKRIAHIGSNAPDGTEMATTLLGVGWSNIPTEDGDITIPNFFSIEDGKVIVPERAYEIKPGGEYYCSIMTYMSEANKYVQKNDPSASFLFTDGATVEDIAKLFAFICADR